MRTLFIGGTRRGYLTFKALAEQGAQFAGVISLRQDAHETDRYETPMRSLAESLRVPIHETRALKDRHYGALIAEELRPDIALVVGCRILLPRAIYEIPPLGTLAVHDSLLPEYRGFAPLNWSIINGADHTGVTLFYLSDAADEGDIVAQQRIEFGPDETAPEVYDRVCAATVELVLGAYPLLAAGTAPRRPQSGAASYTCSRTPVDGIIDWSQSTRTIYNLVRGLAYPYPGAFTYHEGNKLTVWRARPMLDPPTYTGRIPGRVVAISRTDATVDVLTGDGVLRRYEVQLDGGVRSPAADAIHSVRCTLGLRVEHLLERIKTLEETVNRLVSPRAVA
jgi:methionyl-tRNA formyltransferase